MNKYVYVVIYYSENYLEILDIYSDLEKAEQALRELSSVFITSAAGNMGLKIICKKLR